MHSHTIDYRIALLRPLREIGRRVVLLQRRNRIKRAPLVVSVSRGKQESVRQTGNPAPELCGLKLFHRWVKESVALHRQSEVFWAKALGVLSRDSLARVDYEDFIDEPGKVKTMEHLAPFVGIEGFSYEASPFKKATSDSLEEAVVNFSDLSARYAGTEFAEFLAG